MVRDAYGTPRFPRKGTTRMVTPNGKSGSPIGLVLSGGGAKGAFQAGVWRAMCEMGLADRVEAVSGTSIGALNGAAFATTRNPDDVERLWLENVGTMASANLRALSTTAIAEGVANMLSNRAFPFHGLLDRGALERLVGRVLPQEWPPEVPAMYATALECRAGVMQEWNPESYRLRRFRIDREPDPDTRAKELLASAAIPWGFDPVKIGNSLYVDGGWDAQGGDNVPIAPILDRHPGIRTLVVVRCNSAEVEPEALLPGKPTGVRVVEVRPHATLPGILGELPHLLPDGPLSRLLKSWSATLAFDRTFAEQYIHRGYRDALHDLRPLRPRLELEW